MKIFPSPSSTSEEGGGLTLASPVLVPCCSGGVVVYQLPPGQAGSAGFAVVAADILPKAAVQWSFSLLHTSAMLLLSFRLHPGSCLLHPCLWLAMECSKMNMLIAMIALLFLHAILTTQPKGGGLG